LLRQIILNRRQVDDDDEHCHQTNKKERCVA
jgi:hypothetical protein